MTPDLDPAHGNAALAALIEKLLAQRALEFYQPYPKQKEFHRLGTTIDERLLMAANQVGKTVCASRETAYHATGRYPDWWEGQRWTRRTVGWTGSPTGQTSRDTVQRLLLGRTEDGWGTGAIPEADIFDIKRASGSVPNQVESIIVKSVFGGVSTITLKTYDQGRLRWQGESIDYVWYDEEPPEDIYSEGKTRTQASKPRGTFVYMTFTPLLGMTSVVNRLTKEKPARTQVIGMTIHDAQHYTDEERARIIAGYLPHEREARALGIPVLGSGRVFTIPEEELRCEPVAIPAFWYRINGMDFGWDHPTANAWLAWDKDNDIIYVYAVHRQRETTPLVYAAAIKARGPWIPVAWPHDGLQHDKGSGVQLAQQYKAQGVNMLKMRATHPPLPGKEEGSGGFGVEAGIQDMIDRMQTGRWKVFRTCADWFDEYRMYHRKDGLIVKEGDDLMAASRIGNMMKRFAKVAPAPARPAAPRFVVTDPSMGVLGSLALMMLAGLFL
ncbi:MAG: terminase family protein [Nitrospirales bacterium]|nr:terminase family protein [Nitrospirales bacterium]